MSKSLPERIQEQLEQCNNLQVGFLARSKIVELLGGDSLSDDMISDQMPPPEQKETIVPAVRRVNKLSQDIFFALDSNAPDAIIYLLAQFFRELKMNYPAL